MKPIDFLVAWAPAPWTLTAIALNGRIETQSFKARADAEAWIAEHNGVRNLYFTINPLKCLMDNKPRKGDVRGVRALHVDLDPRKGKDIDAERKRILIDLGAFSPAPSVIIDSGGGYQAFWILNGEQPIRSEADALMLEAYNVQLESDLGADACHNIDRIMRLPGTMNLPNERKRKAGRTERKAEVIKGDFDLVHSLADFVPAPRLQSEGASVAVELPGRLPEVDLDALEVPNLTRSLIVNGHDPDDIDRYPSDSEALFAVICAMVRADLDDESIAAVILDADYGISRHVLKQPRSREYAARQIQRAREKVADPALAELNERHAVILDMGGKCLVMNEQEPSFQSPHAFRDRYINRAVEVGKKVQPLGDWWFRHPLRRQYERVRFLPGAETPADVYNLWRGFAVVPKRGDCSLYERHLRENVCGGNLEHFDYLWAWMARAVQQPATQGEVAVVLRGGKGTGKSFAATHFGRLFGRHFRHISNAAHLTGRFNAHLQDCVILFADEAFFAGDKRHEAVLKTMITENTLFVERKGIDAVASPNYCHLMMAGNDRWVVPASGDERRYFVLEVKDAKQRDADYFGSIRAQMDAGGREALLYLLLHHDISDYDVRAVPRTEELAKQRTQSLSSEEAWWLERLEEGVVLPVDNDWAADVEERALHHCYLEWADRMRLGRRLTRAEMRLFLAEILGAAPNRWHAPVHNWNEEKGISVEGRRWKLVLPALADARAAWDKQRGHGKWN